MAAVEEPELLGTFWDHLQELRQTLIGIGAIILIAMAFSFFYYQPLLKILEIPLQNLQSPHSALDIRQLSHQRITNNSTQVLNYTPSNANRIEIPPGGSVDVVSESPYRSLVVLGPLEGITTTLKICFWCGIVTSSPVWLLLLMRFIAPAFERQSRRVILPFLLFSIIALCIGILFAYFITLPLANRYLYAFNLDIASNMWSLSHYFDYTVLLLLANGLAAELALFLFLLVHMGILSGNLLASKRRHMIVAAFILAALLTPPDVLTQFLLAVPLILLYEIAIWYARFRQRIK